MASVFRPNAAKLIKAGFARYKDVPVLFDRALRYMRDHSRYLRERATLAYRPLEDRGDVPSFNTLRRIAYSLANFAKWTDSRGLDWRTVDYDDVLRYQHDQLSGAWSKKREKLEPETANGRTDEVVHFLRWAHLEGLRPAFEFKTRLQERRFGGKVRTITVRVRRAKASVSPPELGHLPKPEEIKAWLTAVRVRRGEAKQLVSRFALETGARKQEIAQVKLSHWPSEDKIDAAIRAGDAFVSMRLLDGTKGGKPRSIRVPIAFAIVVRAWLPKRATYAYRYFKRTGRQDRPPLPFRFRGARGDAAERRHDLEDIPRSRTRPEGWTTHHARHAHACYLVLYALENEAKAARSTIAGMGIGWIRDRSKHWLDMIRSQFGHVSEKTTELYLRWIITSTGLSQLAAGWHDYLNSEDAS